MATLAEAKRLVRAWGGYEKHLAAIEPVLEPYRRALGYG
jgi:hypothetical protein